MAKASFDVSFAMPPEFDSLIRGLDGDLVIKAIDAGLRSGSQVVLKKMQGLVPDGSVTGTSKKQSKTYRDKYNKQPLKDKLALVVRKYDKRALAVIGARYPDGNEIFPLVAGHKKVLWSKSKTVSGYVKPHDDWLRQAYFSSVAEAAKIAMDKAGQVIERQMQLAGATVARAG